MRLQWSSAKYGMRRCKVSLIMVAALFACGGRQSLDVEPSSIVLITVDTLRADHLGSYGYFRDTSPNIDAFASEAVLFENAFTPIATTLPAHVSLMTSTYPLRHRIYRNGHRFTVPFTESGILLFSQMAEDLGFATAAFVSAAPLKSRSGIAAGFEVFEEPEAAQIQADVTNSRVFRWLDEGPSQPFFLWVHYFDPHLPHEPPPPYDSVYGGNDELVEFLSAKKYPELELAEVHDLNNRYDGEIRYTDAQIGLLLEKLKVLGLYRDSAVVITADHGEGLGQHDWIDHGRIYNEQLHVPLIMKFPDWRHVAPRRARHLVSLIDIVPTLVEALELKVPQVFRGQLTGVDILRTKIDRQTIFGQRTRRKRDWEPGDKYAVLSLDWKYFYLPEADDQLFDMRSDREETDNVIGRQQEVAAVLKDEILTLISSYMGLEAGFEIEEDLSPETLEELRSLGYLQ